MKEPKKNYTYSLSQSTARKIESIVMAMKDGGEADKNGKTYSKNTAITEAIDYYYNTVVNHDPSFFVRIADGIMSTALQKYFKLFSDSINQILIEQNRQKALNERIASKLDIDIIEAYFHADKEIMQDLGGNGNAK